MTVAPQDSPRCSRCRAPISRSGGRCPFCGAPIEGVDGARPFEPAVVGMTDEHLSRDALKRGTTPPPKRGHKSGFSKADMIKAVLVAMAALVVVVFVLSRRSPRPAEEPAKAPPSAPEPAMSVAAPLNVNGVAIAAPGSIDATDMLPAVKRRLAEPERQLSLLSLEVSGAKDGAVDLDNPNARIVYRFLVEQDPPRRHRDAPSSAEILVFTLAADPPAIERSKADGGAKPVIEPTCVWSAAWRAAVASGLSAQEPVDASFGTNSTSGTHSWVFTPKNRPELSREIDGQTCAIKTR